MSAVLAGASAQFTFHGAAVTLSCGSATELLEALAKFGLAANDAAGPGNASAQAPAPAPSSATTAAPTAAPKQTAAASTPTAAPAAAPSQASTAATDLAPEVSFDQLKKAFLGLSTKADGRAKCEGVLKPFGLAKLSEAKPEQYAAVLAAIEEASK